MGLLSSLIGGGNSGGGFFGSGGKSNSGNTITTSKAMHSADLIEGNTGIINSIRFVEGQGATVNMTDHGAIDKATTLIDTAINTVASAANSIVDVVLGVSADNKSLSEFAMMEVSASADTSAMIASESAANNAYLTDTVLNNNNSLVQGFGNDLAIITDNAMTNNAILVDKTIDTALVLTENQQIALDNMGQQLADANRQHADDLGFLTGQNIQANNQLTSQYMQSVEWLATQTNDALQNFGVWTEAALDSALDVAGNVALDDSVEGLQNIFRYLTIGAAVVGVAFAVKGAFK